MKKFYKITLILMVFFITVTATFAQNLLLVNNADGYSQADSALMEYLTTEGFTCTHLEVGTYSSDAATWGAGGTGYNDYDAIFFGEALGSGSIYNFHPAGYPLPCINTEGWALKESAGGKWSWIPLAEEADLFKQLGSADITAAEEANTLVFLGDEETWLGRQYEADEEMIWTTFNDPATNVGADGSNGIALDMVADDAIAIANLKSPVLDGKPIMWAIPAGTTITTDPSSAAPLDVTLEYPMVYLGAIHKGQAEPTEDFHKLVLNSLKWVLGDYEEETSVIGVQSNRLNVYPNPTNGMVNISLELPVSGNVSINIYDITGKLMQTVDSEYYSAGGNTININLSDMAGALYYYEIITDNDLYSGKIIKN